MNLITDLVIDIRDGQVAQLSFVVGGCELFDAVLVQRPQLSTEGPYRGHSSALKDRTYKYAQIQRHRQT